jgi:hypothetical protein
LGALLSGLPLRRRSGAVHRIPFDLLDRRFKRGPFRLLVGVGKSRVDAPEFVDQRLPSPLIECLTRFAGIRVKRRNSATDQLNVVDHRSSTDERIISAHPP